MAIGQLRMSLEGDGHKRLMRDTRKLAGPKANQVFARAINDTGRVVFTTVKRTVAQQVGLKV